MGLLGVASGALVGSTFRRAPQAMKDPSAHLVACSQSTLLLPHRMASRHVGVDGSCCPLVRPNRAFLY